MLVYTGGKMPEGEAEQKRVVKDWETWYSRTGKAVIDQGNPFTSYPRISVPMEGSAMVLQTAWRADIR
jgi:hypothetical protein